MYAIIRTGGKQYQVREGQVLLVERLGKADGQHVFSDVLLVSDGVERIAVGTPTVAGASVTATVLGELAGPKVMVFKSKKRKGMRRKRGHRQTMARVKIDSISA